MNITTKQISPTRRAISFVCALALLVGGLLLAGQRFFDISGWVTHGYHGPDVTGRGANSS
jgi:hypothetical protein